MQREATAIKPRRASKRGPRPLATDGRTTVAKRWASIYRELSGKASGADDTLIRTAASLVLQGELLAASIARGEEIDADVLIRLSGAVRRALDRLGAKPGEPIDEKDIEDGLIEPVSAPAALVRDPAPHVSFLGDPRPNVVPKVTEPATIAREPETAIHSPATADPGSQNTDTSIEVSVKPDSVRADSLEEFHARNAATIRPGGKYGPKT